MSYAVFAVANEFIRRRPYSNGLTPMKIQKLIYYTNLWYSHWKGFPLVDEPFCRWQYGPVIPSLYHQLKNYGSHDVHSLIRWTEINDATGEIKLFTPYVDQNDKEALSCIEQVFQKYGKFSGSQLSDFSHQAGSAWSIIRDPETGKIEQGKTREEGQADGNVIIQPDIEREAVHLLSQTD